MMRDISIRGALMALAIAAPLGAAAAQEAGDSLPPLRDFYQSEAPVTFTLTANFDRLRRDRQADPPWRAATVTVTDDSGRTRTIAARVRTRGIWRRANCRIPPLRLDFPRGALRGTPLEGLDRPKLVNACQDDARGERYLLQELQLYRVYRLLTPISHRVRLLRVTYADSGTGRVRTTRHAFFLEEPRALGSRLGAREVETMGAVSEDLDPRGRALLGVFQFFIGNTDWSTAGRHNVELFERDGVLHPVPYDFDYTGAVNAHYAVPPPQVRIANVRQRVFRGHCAPEQEFQAVFAAFLEQRPAIQSLYGDAIGMLIPERERRSTLEYFDEFYELIGNPDAVRRQIHARCASSQ